MKFALACAAFLFSPSAFAAANDFYADLFVPGMNMGTRAKLEQRNYGREFAAGRIFGLKQTRFDASIPVVKGEESSWRTTLFADYDAIESGASFSNGRVMPNQLWEPGAGISHTRNLPEGRSAGGSFSVSSPSDRPFSRARDYGFNLNLTYRLPQADGNAWILFLGVSNTRGFLPYVPMPGAAYFFKAGPKVRGLVGVPFGMIFWTPADLWTVTAFYFPIRVAELRVAYGSPRGIQPFAFVAYRGRNYRLFDRSNDKERLFMEEGVAQSGVSLPLYQGVLLELSGGWSFGRKYFLAEKITDRSGAPSIAPDNALFGSAKLSSFF